MSDENIESVMVLLNNIEEMVTISNMRKEAIDAMTALGVYAKAKHINVPERRIALYISVVYDSRPETLSHIVREIASEIVNQNRRG